MYFDSMAATGFMGFTGAQGAQGATGAFMPTAREVFYPGREGRTVSEALVGEDVVGIRALASTSGRGVVSLNASMIMYLVRGGQERSLNRWDAADIFEKEPEAMATSAAAFLMSAEVLLGQEELNAMFVVARREALKMAAVVASELFVSHLSRDEIAEAWDVANVLRVMQG
jgi:hypothetical protein